MVNYSLYKTVPSKWDTRFLGLCDHIKQWSKDPSTKVGACIVDTDKRIVSLGYNGFPVNITDSETRLQTRDIKYDLVVHAEMNALAFANRSVKGYTMYASLLPCVRCATMIIQHGIGTVCSPMPENSVLERWGDSFNKSIELFSEAGVAIELIT